MVLGADRGRLAVRWEGREARGRDGPPSGGGSRRRAHAPGLHDRFASAFLRISPPRGLRPPTRGAAGPAVRGPTARVRLPRLARTHARPNRPSCRAPCRRPGACAVSVPDPSARYRSQVRTCDDHAFPPAPGLPNTARWKSVTKNTRPHTTHDSENCRSTVGRSRGADDSPSEWRLHLDVQRRWTRLPEAPSGGVSRLSARVEAARRFGAPVPDSGRCEGRRCRPPSVAQRDIRRREADAAARAGRSSRRGGRRLRGTGGRPGSPRRARRGGTPPVTSLIRFKPLLKCYFRV